MSNQLTRSEFFRRGRASAAASTGAAPVTAQIGIEIDGRCLDVKGTTCRLCENECTEFAIAFRLATRGRALPVVTNDNCTGCAQCLTVCPIGAIHPIFDTQESVQ